jgi:vacuolar-type H+-ATPase subunit H
MDIDLIGEVKKTESTAEQIIKNADTTGQEKLNQAITEMNKLISKTKEQLKQEIKTQLEKTKKDAEVKAKEIEAKTANHVKQLKNLDQPKVDKAINLIIECLTKEMQQ